MRYCRIKKFVVVVLLIISNIFIGNYSYAKEHSGGNQNPHHRFIDMYPVSVFPYGIAIDNNGNVWITNPDKNTISKLNSLGTLISTYKVGVEPVGIAIDQKDHVWVTNFFSNNITELSEDGVIIGTYKVGSNPVGIAIDQENNIYVVNYGDSCVNKLAPTGKIISTYQVGSSPLDIAIDQHGNAWVTCIDSGEVVKITPGGVIQSYKVGNLPTGIAIDASGNVWVANNESNSVTELDPSGNTLATYKAGFFPWSIAIDGSGNVWVANNGSNKVTELNPYGFPLGPYPEGIAIDKNGHIWVANNGSSRANNVTKVTSAADGPQYFANRVHAASEMHYTNIYQTANTHRINYLRYPIKNGVVSKSYYTNDIEAGAWFLRNTVFDVGYGLEYLAKPFAGSKFQNNPYAGIHIGAGLWYATSNKFQNNADLYMIYVPIEIHIPNDSIVCVYGALEPFYFIGARTWDKVNGTSIMSEAGIRFNASNFILKIGYMLQQQVGGVILTIGGKL